MGSEIAETSKVSDSVVLGEDVRIFDFVNLYGCRIGDRTKIGTFVEIQKNASVGADCKISSHSFVCEGVHIGDRVFIGHNVTFINDIYPRATGEDGQLQDESDWEVVETHVGDGASIGSSVTLLAGITIGSGAMVGAGSVVTKNVGEREIWAGNPARFVRRME
jgi:acetyltransferase-like isoleucine patch superfamily enzyme